RWLHYFCQTDPDALALSTDNVSVFSKILDDIRINGVWKRTNPARLPKTETALVKHLDCKLKDLHVLDLGASDGSTTLDMA
ncbi:hypothetical protein, partial [Kiloniella majae]